MKTLLQINTSIFSDSGQSSQLAQRFVAGWRELNPGATVTVRDFAREPVPHLDAASFGAFIAKPEERTAEQRKAVAYSDALIAELKAADVIVLGLPLYNFGPPSAVKAWVDHLIAYGLSIDPETGEGLLGGRDVLVLAARGGGYGPGTPRHGWDHAEPWLPHGLSLTGLEPRFVVAELTLADVNPAMAELKPLAAESLAAAEAAIDEAAIDEQWSAAVAA